VLKKKRDSQTDPTSVHFGCQVIVYYYERGPRESSVTVLDRMVELGWIKAMARNASGKVQFIPTEQGYEIIKSLKQLFSSDRPFTPIELSICPAHQTARSDSIASLCTRRYSVCIFNLVTTPTMQC
jgi:hypothetical protein